jgi:hypothetical protein
MNSFYLFLIISTLGAYERQLSRIMRLLISKIKTHSKEPEGFPPVRGEPWGSSFIEYPLIKFVCSFCFCHDFFFKKRKKRNDAKKIKNIIFLFSIILSISILFINIIIININVSNFILPGVVESEIKILNQQ